MPAKAARLNSTEPLETTACVIGGGLILKDAQPGAGVVVVVEEVVVDDVVVELVEEVVDDVVDDVVDEEVPVNESTTIVVILE
jgi:hypothetical protein